MKRILGIIISSFTIGTATLSFGQSFPVDTSFTLHSAFVKEVKKYPFIHTVEAQLPITVKLKKDLKYAEYGNRSMHLDLYIPTQTNEKVHPLVVFIHGGGWKSGNKNMEAPLAIYLAKKGYLTATVEYRLSPEALYPAAVIDIKTAIRWLRKNATEFGIDINQIAVSGTSSGGQMAALIGTTNGTSLYIDTTRYPDHSSDVQAVIDIDGILAFIHPESGEGADRPGKPSAATLWFGGNRQEKTSDWKNASALTHIDSNTPPMLFINSQHPRFHAGRDDLITLLDSLGISSEVHELDSTPHPFWLFDPWFDQTAKWTEEFLNRQFKAKKN